MTLTPEQIDDARARYRVGESQQSIADDYGVSRTNIQSHVADLRPSGFAFNDQPWADQGLCGQTDPEAFFPEKGGSAREAKKVCNGDPKRGTEPCPVRAECLAYAIEHEQRFGVWGGVSERDRRNMLREQRREAVA